MKMLTIFLNLSLSLSAYAVNSTDTIHFIPKKEIPFSEIGKPTTYQGRIEHFEAASSEPTKYEFYQLTFSEPLKMDNSLCHNIAKQLFGSKNVLKINLEQGHTGPVCLFEFHDPIKKQTPAYQLGVIGFIRMKPIALITRSQRAITAEQKLKILKFWQTLR